MPPDFNATLPITIKTNKKTPEVLNLTTENHIIVSSGHVFSDNKETDEDFDDYEKSLAALNGELRA